VRKPEKCKGRYPRDKKKSDCEVRNAEKKKRGKKEEARSLGLTLESKRPGFVERTGKLDYYWGEGGEILDNEGPQGKKLRNGE